MNKRDRHKAIIEIVTSNQIESQEILLKLLFEKDVEVTQATLSRDIKELKIVKTPVTGGGYLYQLTEQSLNLSQDDAGVPRLRYSSIEFSGNLAVLKTRPGYAMAIASEIDRKISKEILGTVAGDDTVLLIIRENVEREEVTQALSQIIDF